MFDLQKWRMKNALEREKVYEDYFDKQIISRDLYVMKIKLLDIQPYSKSWRWGYMKAYKRAIRLIEKDDKDD